MDKQIHSRLKKPRSSISFRELLRISIAHMSRKKARTTVTVGGMAIGVGAIVYLVSIGYGLQELVVSRVAELEELRQIQITTPQGSQLRLHDEAIATLSQLPAVEQALPLISVVGRVAYQNSTSDVAAFGVTTEYLHTSALRPIQGKLFENNLVTMNDENAGSAPAGQVQGIRDVRIREDIPVRFAIAPDQWIVVRESPSRNAPIVGYTKRVIGGMQTGTLVEGSPYQSVDNDQEMTQWIRAQVLLWDSPACSNGTDVCESEYAMQEDASGQQVRMQGYFGRNYIAVEEQQSFVALDENPRVLGITTEEGDETEKAPKGRVLAGTLELVELGGEEDSAAEADVTHVTVSASTPHEAVVNRQFLDVLGLAEEEAVGKTFAVSFVVVSSLLENASQKVESVPVEYTIVGILPEEDSPAMYVPFIDIRSLGVSSYSQVKVIADSQDAVPDIRSRVEAMGYTTNSVLDTVAQINSFFATARIVLAVVGSIALVIAALGMFNTLTVSLLERTHEVGLMKAIGMKSREVRKLFLVESLTMGFLGGTAGLFLGYLAGACTSVILSSIALSRGFGSMSVAAMPLLLVAAIMALALIVGIGTGLYPSYRATKISALNALRYE